MTSQNSGFLLALSSSFIYGLYPVFSHYFVNTMDPLLFGGLGSLCGSLPLLIYLKTKNKTSNLSQPKFIKPLLWISLLVVIANILFFIGTKLTTGINTSLLLQIEPLYAIVLASIFLKEIVKKLQLISTIALVLGATLIIYNQDFKLNIGDLFIILVPLFYQFSHLISKHIINDLKDPNVLPAFWLFSTGIALTIIALILNPSSLNQVFTLQNLINILFFGLILRALEVSLWYQALNRISLSKVSALIPFSVLVSFIGSIVILKEIPTTQQYLGLILIFTGLIILTRSEIKNSSNNN